MSTSSAHWQATSVVRVIAVSVSAESPNGTKQVLKYNEIQVGTGSQPHKLIADRNGSLRQQFSTPLEITSASQVTLQGPGGSPFKPGRKTRSIATRDLFAGRPHDGTQELSITQDGIRITFTCQAQPSTSSEPAESSVTGALHPTTQTILNDCPRFRILVIGKMGVGKSSLINITFGINKASASDLQRGQARIEDELTSLVNPRFVLHDSLGFEPGEKDKYEIVKYFIRSRQSGLLKDQLHAVWFCIEAPRAGGRLLETAAQDFFKSIRDTLGTTPIVVVFTKLDGVANEEAIKLMKFNQGKLSEGDIANRARSEAESIIRRRYNEITQLAGEPIPFAIVSKQKHYEDTLSSLVQLTYRLVGADGVPDGHTKSMVTMMAQRIDPHLKIHGTIAVGKQRYWKALRASPEFAGHTIQDCLSVIHTDIVAVWNFYDPGHYLLNEKFKELVISVVQNMHLRPANPNRILALSGGSLVTAISAALGAIANPAAPIVIPIVAGLAAAMWIYDIYQNAKTVQQRFIAFIVSLTHIMETLFILRGGEHKRLTRRIIKLACRLYSESDVMAQAHIQIQAYRDLDGRDAALSMIESLISPEQRGNLDLRSYYEEVGKLDLSALGLDKDEEW